MQGNQHRSRARSTALLGTLIVLLLCSGLWDELPEGSLWPSVFFGVLFCLGGYALSHSKRWLIAYLAVALVGFLGLLFGDLGNGVHLLCVTGNNLLLFHAVFRHSIFTQGVDQTDRLLAGIAGYLLLGLFWATQFRWFDVVGVTGFLNHITESPATVAEQLYFSFVTLTTLGYGDIIPVTPFARVLVLFTALSGVLYLAVFISALVGGLNAGRKES